MKKENREFAGKMTLSSLNNTGIINYNGVDGFFIPLADNPTIFVGQNSVSLDFDVVRKDEAGRDGESHYLRASLTSEGRRLIPEDQRRNYTTIIGNLTPYEAIAARSNRRSAYQPQAQQQPTQRPPQQPQGFGPQYQPPYSGQYPPAQQGRQQGFTQQRQYAPQNPYPGAAPQQGFAQQAPQGQQGGRQAAPRYPDQRPPYGAGFQAPPPVYNDGDDLPE